MDVSDTEDWARERLLARLRAMTPLERAQRMGDLTRAAQEMALVRLRSWYPTADERELKIRLAALWYDRETMIRFFGWDPEVHGL